jgi:hypothetical protein
MDFSLVERRRSRLGALDRNLEREQVGLAVCGRAVSGNWHAGLTSSARGPTMAIRFDGIQYCSGQ